MSDVFISYAHSTRREARVTAETLRTLGYSVWLDEDLQVNRAFTHAIQEELAIAKAALVIWSADAAQSDWVLSEANRAREDRKLVQVCFDRARLPMPFDQIQCADLAHWRGDTRDPHWLKVVESIAALVGAEAPKPATTAPHRHPVGAKPRAGRWAWAAIAVAALLAAGAGAWWLRDHRAGGAAASGETRVAVLPLDAPQDVRGFADGLMDEILGVLSNDHIQTISRTESAALRGPNADTTIARLGIGLLLDGSVEETNGSITVRLHVDDPAQRAVVWSEAFTRSAGESDALQAEVGAKAARILTQALGARAAGVTDPATLSDFVTGDEHQRFDLTAGWDAADPYFRRVVARAPQFAGGHAYLAGAEAFESFDPGVSRAAELRADAKREAEEAIKLDPKGYDAFLALSMVTPPGPDLWRAQEAPLQKGMALDPTDPAYPYVLGQQEFAHEGRLRAAAEYLRRAVALDAYWPGPTGYLAMYLMETGQTDEAQQILDRMQRYWPDNWATLDSRFWKELFYGDPDAAIALLANPRTRPPIMDSQSVEPCQAALRALKSNRTNERAAAAAAVKVAAVSGQFPVGAAVELLTRLGDLDGAFAVSYKFPLQVAFYDWAGPPVLFSTTTAALRRDPRFMPLAAKLGLVTYWRSTGNWPDFCAEPGLPYDCKAEAARLAGGHS
jgi:TolB-like protein